MTKTIIPFGPQHPVLPEPVHLKLTLEDEVITEAIPAFGYVHRGLEKLAEIRDFHQMIYVVERICGICSMIHAMCYCQGIEALMGIEAPPRARFLRVIWSELHRIHSHLLWMGLFADSFGFESLFMQCWKIREKILDIDEATTGNRIILSVNVIGGMRKDLSLEQVNWIYSELKDVEKEVKRLETTILTDYTVKKRTVGKGVLTGKQAFELGLVGPVLRASGIAQDMRMLGYAAFNEIDFEPVVETDGDCYARCKVRFREVLQSIDLIRQAIAKLPDGEIAVIVKGRPEGEIISRIEQPRGEVFYYIKANGKKNLERLRVRTPTFANIPALLAMLPGMWLSDVPVIVLSIDPCISCTERKKRKKSMFEMTPTVLRNFFSKRATRRYPAVVRPPFENARGEIQNDIQICTFCGVCAAKCPSQCITVDKKAATWSCNPSACVYCGVCAESCPSGSLLQKSDYRRPAREKEMIFLKSEIKKEIKAHEPANDAHE